ncbi:MAG TPA: hypothetical protein VGR23_07655, partial [Candidatus Dormibacteraeota bacterium]|nr:hypothetical protein [Candidatus Dormibacteraeota bacterium]
MAQRVPRIDMEAVLAGYESRALQMRDQFAAALHEARPKRQAKQVLALDPLPHSKPAFRDKAGHEGGYARPARRSVDGVV